MDRNVKISNPASKVLILEGNSNFFISTKIFDFKKRNSKGLTSQGETFFQKKAGFSPWIQQGNVV
jgi:hypothetical protein